MWDCIVDHIVCYIDDCLHNWVCYFEHLVLRFHPNRQRLGWSFNGSQQASLIHEVRQNNSRFDWRLQLGMVEPQTQHASHFHQFKALWWRYQTRLQSLPFRILILEMEIRFIDWSHKKAQLRKKYRYFSYNLLSFRLTTQLSSTTTKTWYILFWEIFWVDFTLHSFWSEITKRNTNITSRSSTLSLTIK